MAIKLDSEKIKKYQQFNSKDFFGDWITDYNEIGKTFKSNKPFKYNVIDNFLNSDFAEKINSEFPMDLENYHKYYNPLEVKYACNNIDSMCDTIQSLFYTLSSKKIVKVFSEVTGIEDLEIDPYLHGAGLHLHPRFGRLGVHLDYEKHPFLENKERRLNVIIYMSKNWKPEYKGNTELWNPKVTECFYKSEVKFNKAIIFQTNEISFHGLPDKILCPDGEFRKTIAYYYISPLTSLLTKQEFRTKAVFVKRPNEPFSEKLELLYKIRPMRLITKEDMEEIWPEWTPELC